MDIYFTWSQDSVKVNANINGIVSIGLNTLTTLTLSYINKT